LGSSFLSCREGKCDGPKDVCVGDVGPPHRAKVLPFPEVLLLGSLGREQRVIGRLHRECKVPKEGLFLDLKKSLKSFVSLTFP